MKNEIKTFTLFIRSNKDNKSLPDEKSNRVANTIRDINAKSSKPMKETNDGDLIIAIGGDGTFIDAVTSTGFNKNKIYVGVHTGTLGFLQNLSPDEVFSLINYINYEEEINTRKLLISSVDVFLTDGTTLQYHSLNEILVAGFNYSKISFAEYVNNDFLQNVSGNGISIATNTGDTAYSMNSGGAIDFSDHYQLVCTPLTLIQNAAYERFIRNPIICSKVSIVPKPCDNITIIIDGITRSNIDSLSIKRVDVSMLDGSNYINKFELETYSKCNVIRTKILGYDFNG